jgi:hypothetical protein
MGINVIAIDNSQDNFSGFACGEFQQAGIAKYLAFNLRVKVICQITALVVHHAPEKAPDSHSLQIVVFRHQ